jgi:hypothetical protein
VKNKNSHNQVYARPDEQMGRQKTEDLRSRDAVLYNRAHHGLDADPALRPMAKQVTRKKRRQRDQKASEEGLD